jgi:hypothetical protein
MTKTCVPHRVLTQIAVGIDRNAIRFTYLASLRLLYNIERSAIFDKLQRQPGHKHPKLIEGNYVDRA